MRETKREVQVLFDAGHGLPTIEWLARVGETDAAKEILGTNNGKDGACRFGRTHDDFEPLITTSRGPAPEHRDMQGQIQACNFTDVK